MRLQGFLLNALSLKSNLPFSIMMLFVLNLILCKTFASIFHKVIPEPMDTEIVRRT